MYASAQTRAGVQAMLQQWKDAYSQRDLEGALAVIAPDEDVVGIGTGPDEWRVGPDQFKAQMERDFAQAEALSVAYEPLVVSEAGPVAWVAGRASVQARVEGWGWCWTWPAASSRSTRAVAEAERIPRRSPTRPAPAAPRQAITSVTPRPSHGPDPGWPRGGPQHLAQPQGTARWEASRYRTPGPRWPSGIAW
jgi:ketosteroid isomerase-like protein